ncbi:MAG: lipopolysaccharide kinase InaA family protein [Candidatus Bathyarchaeia archaeon]
MSLKQESPDESLKSQIYTFCRQIANSRPIISVCLCDGSMRAFFGGTKALLEFLLIIKGFKPRLMNYVRFFDDRPAIFYAVDRWVFEKDVDVGFLGEAFAVHLIFPYTPLVNAGYLRAKEVKLKKRLILELLENLVLTFPELSREIRIKPEYFVYESMLNRARLFPPMYNTLSHFFQNEVREQNFNRVMEGYLIALKELEKEGLVECENGFYKISKSFIENFKSRKTLFTNLFRSAQKALFMSLLGAFPKVLGVLSERADILLKFQFFESEKGGLKMEFHIEDPKKYLFVPTAHGFVSLAVQVSVEDFVDKILKIDGGKTVIVEALGGVLNDVYLIRVPVNGEERRFVVKSFKDWSGFKWFPLTLWTVGTRTFTILGRSRLERECSINHFLYSRGFAVPKLLGMNHSEGLIFMEYVEGETLDKIVKRILSQPNVDKIGEELKLIRRVGEIFAKVHALDVTLGDTKPENILIGKDNKIYLMDFEQASRKGDKAWDIAEFLYFVGHYVPSLTGTKPVEAVANTFIEGYLEGGGSLEVVRAAGKPKYTKVFSVFVLPHVILTISNICRKAGKKNGEK